MAGKTTNYSLNTIDLTDSPPDITVLNENMEIIDNQMKENADKASEALPKSYYTAEDILNKLKTVDGVNSGLDADLFKGNSIMPIENGGTGSSDSQAAFTKLGKRPFMGKSTDVNSPNQEACYISNGWRQTGGAKDLPTNPYGILDNKEAGGYVMQTYGCTNLSGQYGLYVRLGVAPNIVDLEWQQVYTSLNAASLIKGLLTGGEVSVVKSVQSGKATISGTAYYGATPVSVSINSVTPTKCLVILNGGINISGMYVSVILNSLTANTLKVSTGYGISSAATGHFSWQVIEFY